MVLGADDRFVTQRQEPRLALVDVAFSTLSGPSSDAMTLRAGALSASVPLRPTVGPRRRVRVFDDEVDAIDVGGDGAAFFSEYLGQRCSLVYMPLDVIRPVESSYAQPGDRVGFADGYPILVASLASLGDLNERLVARGEAPVPMDRFRPNIVVEGGTPYAEEDAIGMSIGPLSLRTPKRCARCQVTTVDQRTATTGKEPLRTLASYRAAANKVNFAMNAIPDLSEEPTVIAVGDPVVFR